MLENWTKDNFFAAWADEYDCSFEDMASDLGRVCITDNQDAENAWNRFVIAYQDLMRF